LAPPPVIKPPPPKSPQETHHIIGPLCYFCFPPKTRKQEKAELPPRLARRAGELIEGLRFGERTSLAGGHAVLTPVSSGYSLGACNWLLETSAGVRIVLISESSLRPDQLGDTGSASDDEWRHVRALELSLFANADVVVARGVALFGPGHSPRPSAALRLAPAAHSESHSLPANSSMSSAGPQLPGGASESGSDSFHQAMDEICAEMCQTLRDGGNVLVPACAEGVVLDLMERLRTHLSKFGLAGVPMFVAGPSSRFLVSYCNIAGEWSSEQRMRKMYIPENPFPFEEWAGQSLLACASTAAGLRDADALNAATATKATQQLTNAQTQQQLWREPCVVFSSAVSLSSGPTRYLLEQWGLSSRCLLVLCDAQAHSDAAVVESMIDRFRARADVFNIRVLNRILDVRLDRAAVSHLLGALRPIRGAVLVAPGTVSEPEAGQAATRWIVPGETTSVSLDGRTEFEPVQISADLAMQLQPTVLGPAAAPVSVADVEGILRAPQAGETGPVWTLDVARTEDETAAVASLGEARSLWGRLDAEKLVLHLHAAGARDAALMKRDAAADSSAQVISVPSLGATITVAGGAHTEIEADDYAARQTILGAVTSALGSLPFSSPTSAVVPDALMTD
jgi:hypothetical protein